MLAKTVETVNGTAITIELSKTTLAILQERASSLGIQPEELAQVYITDLLQRPDLEFERIVDYLLDKNRELYQRLA